MDAKIFKFYQALKYHEFTEEQMEDVVEGIKVITRDESRDHATKADLEKLSQATRADMEKLSLSIKADMEKLSERMKGEFERMEKRTDEIKGLVYDKYAAIVLWVVSTGIAITGLIIAVTKLL